MEGPRWATPLAVRGYNRHFAPWINISPNPAPIGTPTPQIGEDLLIPPPDFLGGGRGGDRRCGGGGGGGGDGEVVRASSAAAGHEQEHGVVHVPRGVDDLHPHHLHRVAPRPLPLRLLPRHGLDHRQSRPLHGSTRISLDLPPIFVSFWFDFMWVLMGLGRLRFGLSLI